MKRHIAPRNSTLPADPSRQAESARNYARASRAANSRRAYATSLTQWLTWADANNACPMPAQPEAVAVWLSSLADAGAKPSTIGVRLAGVVAAHRDAGHALDTRHPAISRVVAGIRRTKGVAPNKKTAILTSDLAMMIAALPLDTTAGIRDRALLLIGFTAALRRSELVALDVEDVLIDAKGLTINVRRSKTDQTGEGASIAIHRAKNSELCATRALQAWLKKSRIKTGPLFRPLAGKKQGVRPERLGHESAALIVKRAAERAGLDGDAYSGHSLRAGLATSAALAGADLAQIMKQTRHKSTKVAEGYIRIADRWRRNVTEGLL